jgi:hypothetical protein
MKHSKICFNSFISKFTFLPNQTYRNCIKLVNCVCTTYRHIEVHWRWFISISTMHITRVETHFILLDVNTLKILMKITNYYAPYYVIFPILLLFPLS